jgi:hypothetical protein
MTSELLRQLDLLAAAIRKKSTVNVNARDIKDSAVAAGSYYFKTCRPDVVRIITDEGELSSFDEKWQDLIRLAQGNNARLSYLSLISKLLKKMRNLNVVSHLPSVADVTIAKSKINHSQAERILIATLEKMIPTAAASYQQGLHDLAQDPSRLSYRGTACEFREALRETLDLLAPDSDVMGQSWYKQEPGTSGPTMRQKVKFVLSARGKTKTQQGVAERSIDLIDGLCGAVTRAVYTNASLSTHVQTTRSEVCQMKRYLDPVLFDILEIGQY